MNLKKQNKNVVDGELKYQHYKNILLNKSYMRHEINRIQRKNHKIGSYRINKISLSSYDDKKVYSIYDVHRSIVFTY